MPGASLPQTHSSPPSYLAAGDLSYGGGAKANLAYDLEADDFSLYSAGRSSKV